MPGIEGVPPTAKVDFKPAAEIHGTWHGRDADVPKVARGIPRRDTETATEGQSQVREVTADTGSLHKDLIGCLGGAGRLVIEADVGMHPVADGLDTSPALRCD